VLHDGQIVRDEEVGDAEFLLQVVEEVDNLPARRRRGPRPARRR
jgi:hypothetical protein